MQAMSFRTSASGNKSLQEPLGHMHWAAQVHGASASCSRRAEAAKPGESPVMSEDTWLTGY